MPMFQLPALGKNRRAIQEDIAYFCGQAAASTQVAQEIADLVGLSHQAFRIYRDWASRHVIQSSLARASCAAQGLLSQDEAERAIMTHPDQLAAGRRSMLVLFATVLADEQDGWAGRALGVRLGRSWPHHDPTWPEVAAILRPEALWDAPETECVADFLLEPEQLPATRLAWSYAQVREILCFGDDAKQASRQERRRRHNGTLQEPAGAKERAWHRRQLDQLVEDVPERSPEEG